MGLKLQISAVWSDHWTNCASSTFAISNHFFLHPPHIWQTPFSDEMFHPEDFPKEMFVLQLLLSPTCHCLRPNFLQRCKNLRLFFARDCWQKKTFNVLMPFSTFDHLRLKFWLKFWLVSEPIKFLQPHFLNATFENVISSNPRRVAEFARRKKTFGALDF